MNGIDAHSGAALSGFDHLRQSVHNILTTPLGSRVMRRDYGSRLYRLVDEPMNRSTILDLYAATAEALGKWEPRLDLQSMRADELAPGRVSLSMVARYLPTGEEITLSGIEVA